MNPKFRFLYKIILVLIIGFILMQPYKWFCQLSQSCTPISFSKFIPRVEGVTPIKMTFDITNYKKDLDIKVLDPAIETVSGRKNTIKYVIKNNSNHLMRFHFKMYVEPKEMEKYIIRHQCLCFGRYKLKPGEEKEVEMIFEIDHEISSSDPLDRSDVINIRYEARMI